MVGVTHGHTKVLDSEKNGFNLTLFLSQLPPAETVIFCLRKKIPKAQKSDFSMYSLRIHEAFSLIIASLLV